MGSQITLVGAKQQQGVQLPVYGTTITQYAFLTASVCRMYLVQIVLWILHLQEKGPYISN